ncbi:RES family NAD+ phosphorylase [Flavobacterium gelidilacus]|uniref:RES family NAD+ phosphorylase n=1 Tax=Flavobacterium gelidilacus TaxID=206041 RepID=UPI000427B49E|nr:RES family NAD+ phosphorylase [Flavobacterium gelidilacus]
MEHSEFPNLSNVRKAIKKFEQLKWPDYDEGKELENFIEEFDKIITSELGIIFNYLMPLKHKEFALGIFRAREVNSFNNINLFTEHSYPPPSITKFGRCNFPKHPVFYGSNNAITALIEVIRNTNVIGKRFCISSWKINNPEENLIFENFLQADLHPGNNFNILAKAQINKIGEPFKNKLSKSKKEGMVEVMKFLDTQFLNDSNYSFSAALAHRQIYARHNYNTDILLYPSVQSDRQGVNLAINPNFVDNHLQLKRCYIVEVNSYDIKTGRFSITFFKYGDVIKNQFFWKKLDPEDAIYQKYFREDFKEYMDKDYKFEFEKH